MGEEKDDAAVQDALAVDEDDVDFDDYSKGIPNLSEYDES